jgi:ribosomal protein L4
MKTHEEAFHELSYYTLAQPREYFIHQHSVDAYAAQTADETTKPIKLIFALVGLYLYIEKGFSGREVQLFHMKMAKRKVAWPKVQLPVTRGNITVFEVLATPEGLTRNHRINQWCIEVWKAYHKSSNAILALVNQYQ